MKINKYYIIFPIVFSILSYVLTSQIIICFFCLLVSFTDSLFIIRKDANKKGLIKYEENFKRSFKYNYYLFYKDNYQGDILNDILKLYENSYLQIDKEGLGEQIINECTIYIDNQIEDYRKKRKVNLFYSKLHITSIDDYFEYLENEKNHFQQKNNLLITYFLSAIGILFIKLIFNNFFQALLTNNIAYLAIVIFLGVFWIISRIILFDACEDVTYDG